MSGAPDSRSPLNGVTGGRSSPLSTNSCDEQQRPLDSTDTRRVAFVENRPGPISPTNLPHMIKSVASELTMGWLSCDGEEPVSKEHASLLDKESQEHDDELGKTTIGNDKGEDHPPKATPEETPVEASALSIEIPDDESEASLMVLMRYMGCSPIKYGDGPPERLHNGPMSSQYGREYTFESYGESDSLLSDETYGDSTIEDDIEPSWTIENNEVGVEISIQDMILAPQGPVSLSPDGTLVRRVKKKKKKTTDVKGETNLTVETKKKTKKKKSTVEAAATIESPGFAATTSPTAALLAANTAFLKKYAEESKSPKAAGSAETKDAKKPNLTVNITEETIKSMAEAAATIASPGSVHATSPTAALLAANTALLKKYTEESKSPKAAESAETKDAKKPNLTVDIAGETIKSMAESAATIASPGSIPATSPTAALLLANTSLLMKNAEEIKSPNAAGSAEKKKVKKKNLTSNATEETIKSPKAPRSAGKKKVKKPDLKVDTSEDTTKTSTEKSTVVGSPGLVIGRISPSASTPKSPAPKSLTPVSTVPMTSAGQAALRKYEEEIMSPMVAGSAKKKIRKPNLTVDTTSTASFSSPKASSNKSSSTNLSAMQSPASKIEESSSMHSDKEESSSIRSDKENSTIPLTDNKSSAVTPISALSPSSGDEKAAREVDGLLSMTRQWLIRTKSQERTLSSPTPTSPRNIGVSSHLMASSQLDRKIMGGITSNSPLHSPTAQLSSQLSFARKLTSEAKECAPSTLPQSPLSNSSISSPKKSILEQLAALRVKQREIEERQMAKREMGH